MLPDGMEVAKPAKRGPSDHLMHRLKPGFDPGEVRPYYEDRVLVRRIAPPAPSARLVLPMSDRQKVGNQIGVVVSCGGGNTLAAKRGIFDGYEKITKHAPHPLAVKPGDVILYSRVPTQEFEQDGELHTFLYEEQHILAILEGGRL